MLGKKIAKINSIIFILYLGMGNTIAARSMPLTLLEAERIAIASAPELQRLQATRQALIQQSIADGQLPDPKLVGGIVNVPVNSFSFTQDEMTMVQVGLQQAFPPGHTRAIRARQMQARAKAEQRKIQEETNLLLRNVREIWLNIYYWTEAAHVIQENQSIYRRLLKATESQYSAAKGNLSNVLQVQLELSRLNDQQIQIQQQIDTLRAQLGRYIGQNQAERTLSSHLPYWPNLPSLPVLRTRLQQHPLLKVDAANIEAARDEVDLAKEQFMPGFVVDASYGFRQGHMMDGSHRSDMITALVAMDLPFFTAQRQDRRLQASSNQLIAIQLDQQIHYRDLLKELTAQYYLWQRLSERLNLYQKQLLPEAKQNSKAALLAYQSATTDLNTVLRAYSNALTIQLEQLQIKIERTRTRAALFYLEGLTQ